MQDHTWLDVLKDVFNALASPVDVHFVGLLHFWIHVSQLDGGQEVKIVEVKT